MRLHRKPERRTARTAIAVTAQHTDRGIAAVLDAALDRHGLAAGRSPWTEYELAYLLDRDELDAVSGLDGPLG